MAKIVIEPELSSLTEVHRVYNQKAVERKSLVYLIDQLNALVISI